MIVLCRNTGRNIIIIPTYLLSSNESRRSFRTIYSAIYLYVGAFQFTYLRVIHNIIVLSIS